MYIYVRTSDVIGHQLLHVGFLSDVQTHDVDSDVSVSHDPPSFMEGLFSLCITTQEETCSYAAFAKLTASCCYNPAEDDRTHASHP